MKKIILTLMLLTALVFPSGVFADAYSQGEINYNISIDKKIRPINDSNFYDNIGQDQKIFVNDDIVDYRVVVENTGKDILYDLVVTDYYPVVNQIILAPGEIDKTNRQIAWKIEKLEAGESRTFTIRTKVINSSTWKSQTNVVDVKNNNVYDKDTATFYLNGKVIPVTGNTDLVVKSAIVLSLSVIALAMRKVARGY